MSPHLFQKNIMIRKRKLILIFIFVIIAAVLTAVFSITAHMDCSDIKPSTLSQDFLDLSVLYGDNSDSTENNSVKLAANSETDVLEVSNVVIFIYFSDETKPTDIGQKVECFDGDSDSLKDYYNKISYGKIQIDSYFAKNGTIFYAYQSTKSRAFYEDCFDTDTSQRRAMEKSMLENAVDQFDENMDFTGIDLDKNDNGFVDNISFVISGNYRNNEKQWGTLMWPHAYDFASIYGINKDSVPLTLGGVKVFKYTFNFFNNLTTGLLCHEMNHILGSPDFYHYDDGENQYLPVGNWDLMHFECAIPQYMTSYVRYAYLAENSDVLKSIYAKQIGQITGSGGYSLKPVVNADEGDTIAYKIIVNEYESIWVEYRSSNTESAYDKYVADGSGKYGITGSGLIVYRVNEKEYKGKIGNQAAKHNSAAYPDELYVFRPDYSKKSTIAARESENLQKAFISNENPVFSSLGKTKQESGALYDSECIYTSDGRNTGIKIIITAQSDDNLEFYVTVPEDLSKSDQVRTVNVWDKELYELNGQTSGNIEVVYSEDQSILDMRVNNAIIVVVVYMDNSVFIAPVSQYTVVYDKKQFDLQQTAKVRFSDGVNNNIEGSFSLTIKAEAFTASILSPPEKTTYQCGEDLDLSGLELKLQYPNFSETVRYNDSAQKENFSYIGYDKTTSGQYAVIITYTDANGKDDSVGIVVVVSAAIVGLTIDEYNSTSLIIQAMTGDSFIDRTTFDENLKKNMIINAVYGDGEKRVASNDLYTLSYTSWEGYNNFYNVKAVLNGDNSIYASHSVFLLDSDETILSTELKTLPKTAYNYGESLDFDDGAITLKTKVGEKVGEYEIPLKYFYKAYSEQFDCVKTGEQILSAVILGSRITIEVIVGGDTFQLITVKDESIYTDNIGGRIILENFRNMEELYNSISSVFNITWYNNNIEINPRAYSSLAVNSDITMRLSDEFGKEIKAFSIYVLGDTDGNGILNRNDLDILAESLISKKYDFGYDVDKNGKYDIVDFTILLTRAKENEKE